ncbi:hypothetical protein D3C74_323760 [compost metagenome]
MISEALAAASQIMITDRSKHRKIHKIILSLSKIVQPLRFKLSVIHKIARHDQELGVRKLDQALTKRTSPNREVTSIRALGIRHVQEFILILVFFFRCKIACFAPAAFTAYSVLVSCARRQSFYKNFMTDVILRTANDLLYRF